MNVCGCNICTAILVIITTFCFSRCVCAIRIRSLCVSDSRACESLLFLRCLFIQIVQNKAGTAMQSINKAVLVVHTVPL